MRTKRKRGRNNLGPNAPAPSNIPINVDDNPIHRSRYHRYKEGQSPEEIAKQDGVGVITIMNSIRAVEAQLALNDTGYLIQKQVEHVLRTGALAEGAMSQALTATKKTYTGVGKKFKEIIEPDHPIRLQAYSERTKLITAILPKGGGISIDASQKTVMVPGASITQVATFEDRIREIRKKREDQKSIPAAAIDVELDDESETAPQEANAR